MGKKSIQIRKHIEDERLRLDRSLLELERLFATTKNTLLAWWRRPALSIVTAFRRRHRQPPVDVETKPGQREAYGR